MPSKATPSAPKRKRRSQEDVLKRIRDAAQALFAEHGYGATTVREIARVAEVSQTLIFSHYGDKAGLFEEVVAAPFKRLMVQFSERHQDHSTDSERDPDLRALVTQLYRLFDDNKDMLSAALTTSASQLGKKSSEPHGLEEFFENAVNQIEMHFESAGKKPRFDIRIAAPLSFGMIAASTLLKDWLFPSGLPSSVALTDTLSAMIIASLTPNPPS